MAAEVTLVTPVLLMLLVFVAVLVHRGVQARLRLEDAAHQAARAASIERTPAAASAAAQTTATAAVGAAVDCVELTVEVDTGAMRPGGVVSVTLACGVDLGTALILAVPGQRRLSATAVEPVDIWRSDPADTSGDGS